MQVLRRAEPTAEADRGRHPGSSRFNVLAGGPGSLAERSAAQMAANYWRTGIVFLRERCPRFQSLFHERNDPMKHALSPLSFVVCRQVFAVAMIAIAGTL